jgi:type III pantothenate kinase
VFGYSGLVDALIARIRAEVKFTPKVIATGGVAPIIASESTGIEVCDELLTLHGLRILYERNRS